MYDIHITDKLLDKAGLTLEEFLFLMLIDLNTNGDAVTASLIEKGYLSKEGFFTVEGEMAIGDILNLTKAEPSSEERLDNLTTNLMEIFPKGKREGTPYYWRGNRREIKDKLKKFFVYFGDAYTDAQILDAARKYVASFNGDYRYMRLLKYFIWKNDIKRDGETSSIEQISELASYIENAGQENIISRDIDLTLR